MRRFAGASLTALAGFVGCGIDAVGTGPLEGGDAAVPSSPSDSGPADAAVSLATCKDLPPTWGLVAFVTGTDPCPAGYEAGTTELHDGATPRSDTCTCGCTLTTQPTCMHASTGAYYDADGSKTCGNKSIYVWDAAANGGCSTDMYPGAYATSQDWKFSAPTRTGGTCGAASEKHVDRLDFAESARACVPSAGCEGAPSVAAPAARCVISEGDVACPVSGRFGKRTVMPKTFDVTCAENSCSCSVEGTCQSAKITLYAGANCTGSSFSITADGNCQPSPGSGSVTSYKYTAALNGAGCSTTGAPAATVSTTAVATICCE